MQNTPMHRGRQKPVMDDGVCNARSTRAGRSSHFKMQRPLRGGNVMIHLYPQTPNFNCLFGITRCSHGFTGYPLLTRSRHPPTRRPLHLSCRYTPICCCGPLSPATRIYTLVTFLYRTLFWSKLQGSTQPAFARARVVLSPVSPNPATRPLC